VDRGFHNSTQELCDSKSENNDFLLHAHASSLAHRDTHAHDRQLTVSAGHPPESWGRTHPPTPAAGSSTGDLESSTTAHPAREISPNAQCSGSLAVTQGSCVVQLRSCCHQWQWQRNEPRRCVHADMAHKTLFTTRQYYLSTLATAWLCEVKADNGRPRRSGG